MLAELQGKGLEVPMHIDAASGGFVFPFSDPDFDWDFRLDSVKSINVSGHKFGLVYPGVGWLVFRDEEQLPEDLVFYEDYLGERDATFTLNFSGSSSFILAQYYQLHPPRARGLRLDRAGDGRTNAARSPTRLAGEDALELIDGDSRGCRCVIARVREGEPFTGNDLVGELARRRGWMVPAYQLPPDNEDQQIMRMLVKINQTRELVDALVRRLRRLDHVPARAGASGKVPHHRSTPATATRGYRVAAVSWGKRMVREDGPGAAAGEEYAKCRRGRLWYVPEAASVDEVQASPGRS